MDAVVKYTCGKSEYCVLVKNVKDNNDAQSKLYDYLEVTVRSNYCLIHNAECIDYCLE